MKKILLIMVVLTFTTLGGALLFAEEGGQGAAETVEKAGSISNVAKFLGAAIAIGCATLSSGLAIGKIGSAAMGAISERPEAGGPALILAALAEGVSLWGFLIAFFILQS